MKAVEANTVVDKVCPPKFVKPANQWYVTEIKAWKQTIHWFSKDNKEAAVNKYKSA